MKKLPPWTGDPRITLEPVRTSAKQTDPIGIAIVRGDHQAVVMSDGEARDLLEALAKQLGYRILRMGPGEKHG